MKHLILITLAFHYVADSSAQNNVVTYTDKTEQLDCDITSSTSFAQWAEGVAVIFEYTRGEGISKRSPGYENFSINNGTSTSFHLVIADIRLDNEGQYRCTRSGGVEVLDYDVVVEVTPRSVNINTNGNEVINVGESYPFTCTAVGVRSPNVLNLTWSTNNVGEVVVPERSESTPDSDLQDLTSTFELTPQKDDTFIKCGITGYVNQDKINEDLIMDTVNLTVHYAPICTLEFGISEVGESVCTVMLICNCEANPEVTAGEYSYSKDNSLIHGDNDTTTGSVQLDTAAEFSCRGRNIVGSGEQSPALEYTCSTTTTPTMAVMTTSTPVKGQGLPLYGIILIVLVCVGVACGTGIAVYCFCCPTSSRKRSVKGSNNTGNNFDPPGGADNNTVTASTNETTNSAAPVYGVVNKSTKKKSDNTDGNGVNSKLQSEPDQVEYAAVNKPKSDPQPAPRSSKPPGNNTEPEKMELQYADIDHSNRGRSNEIHQPADAPTEYATVQSVIV